MDYRRPSIVRRNVVRHHDCRTVQTLQSLRRRVLHSAAALPTTLRAACRLLRLRYGTTLAAEFGPLALKAVRQQFVETGHSRTYCNRLTDLIRRMFKWASSEQLVAVATWQALTTVSGLRCGHTEAPENEPIGPIDDATVDATLPHLTGHRGSNGSAPTAHRNATRRSVPAPTVRSGPLRRSLDVQAVASQDGSPWPEANHIHRSAGSRDSASRIYCVTPNRSALCRRKLSPSNWHSETPSGKHRYRAAMFPAPIASERKRKRTAGTRYDVHAYRRGIHRACDKAFPAPEDSTPEQVCQWKIDHRWSPNRLRHSAATEIRKRFGLEAAQVVLGHSAADVTQIYAERDMAKAAEVIKQVG